MKTTLEIPDELYRQAKVQAAHENRKMKDLVSEGLRLVLGLTKKTQPRRLRRMTKAPVTISAGNELPALVKEGTAETARGESESRRKALAVMEEIRRSPRYSPKRIQELIAETNRVRKAGWSRRDLGK